MKMLIDSHWVEASDGNWQEVCNPGTGEVIDFKCRRGLLAYLSYFE